MVVVYKVDRLSRSLLDFAQVKDKKLVVDELEAVVVRELFSLYEQHRSALVVARMLNEAGRTTKRHRARNGNVRPGKKWSKDAVLRVLKNPIYAGYMPYGDELHEGEHDPIIDRDRYHRLRAILDARQGIRQQRSRNPAYLLRGILRCAHCHRAMTPASTRKNGSDYRYYRCVTRDKKGRKACPGRPLPAEAIEAFVVERIREATASGELAAEVEQQLQDRIEVRRARLLTERRDLPPKIAKLSAEGRRLVEKIGEATDAASGLLDQRIEEVGTDLGRFEARLTEVERDLAMLDQVEIEGRWVARALANFDDVWDVLTIENRARLVRALVRRVEVDETSGEVTAVLTDLGIEDLAADDGQPPPRASTPTSLMETTA